MRRKQNRILGIFNDVDFLAAQFANDRLHPHALHANACPHRIHIPVPAGDRYLRPFTGFPRARLYHHGVVVNFRNFLLKQALDELAIGARQHDARVLSAPFDTLDDAPHAVADLETLQPGLLPLTQARLGFAAEVADQIAHLHPLHGAIHQFAHAVVEFVKDGVAFRLAHLLHDDLLRRLRRNTPQRFRFLREFDQPAELRGFVMFQGVRQRNLADRVLHLLHDHFHRGELNRARLLIEVGDQFFVPFELFPRRREHRVFHRVDDDLRVDALFLAQQLDGLINSSHARLLFLPLKLQIRLFHTVQRDLRRFTIGRLHGQDIFRKSLENTDPCRRIRHRFPQNDLHFFTDGLFKITRPDQLSFHTGRTYFQCILAAGNQLVRVEDRLHAGGNRLAIGVRNAAFFVDIYTQNPMLAAAQKFNVGNLHVGGAGHAIGDLPDFFRQLLPHGSTCEANKKVGFRPLVVCRR